MTSPFNILDHVGQLTPVEDRGKNGYYHCPVCGDDNFTVSKTGAYQCWGNQCKPEDVRNAVSPLKKADRLTSVQREKIKHSKQSKEAELGTAEVKAQAEHYMLMVGEKVISEAEAYLRLSEWCKSTRHDEFNAKRILKGFLDLLGPSDGTLDPTEDAKVLKSLVKAYAEERDLTCKYVLKGRIRTRFKLNDSQIEALLEQVAPSANLDFRHCSEDFEDRDYLAQLEALSRNEIPAGLSAGLLGLDRVLGGLEEKSLYIIGGKPSQGKSALAQTVTREILKKYRIPTAVFTLEMPARQWKGRWLSAERSIDYRKIRLGTFSEYEWGQVLDCMAYFYELPLFLSEASGITPGYLRRSCLAISEKCKEQYGQGLGLVVVDYLNLMRCPGHANRTQEVSQIARELQSLAKEIGCRVIALSQLRKGDGVASSKEPGLDDLRESGEIAQVADGVVLVHRPGRYDETVPDSVSKLIVAKNRHGKVGECEAVFEGKYMRFLDASGRMG